VSIETSIPPSIMAGYGCAALADHRSGCPHSV
jgi:hypothetical protein